jgi:hypothetical protein
MLVNAECEKKGEGRKVKGEAQWNADDADWADLRRFMRIFLQWTVPYRGAITLL